MFSTQQQREIADAVQKILRDTIAECGGPCEQDFRLCDCGLLQWRLINAWRLSNER